MWSQNKTWMSTISLSLECVHMCLTEPPQRVRETFCWGVYQGHKAGEDTSDGWAVTAGRSVCLSREIMWNIAVYEIAHYDWGQWAHLGDAAAPWYKNLSLFGGLLIELLGFTCGKFVHRKHFQVQLINFRWQWIYIYGQKTPEDLKLLLFLSVFFIFYNSTFYFHFSLISVATNTYSHIKMLSVIITKMKIII